MNITKSLAKARTKLFSISTSQLSKEDTIIELNKVLKLVLEIISYINSAPQSTTEKSTPSGFFEIYKEVFGEDQQVEEEIENLRNLILSTIESLSQQALTQSSETEPLEQIPVTQETNINQDAINKIAENLDEIIVSKEKILKAINFKVKTSSLNTEIKELETTKPFETQKRGTKVFILINSKNLKFQAVQSSELALAIHFTECIFKAICKHYFQLDEESTEDRIDLFFDNHFEKLSLIK